MQRTNIVSLINTIITLLILVCGLATSVAKAADETGRVIPVWTYYQDPPFNIDESGIDLTRLLCAELTRNSQGKWRFVPLYVPKNRILQRLNNRDIQGIVAWVNPLWFDDKRMTKFLWTKGIFISRNEVVSRKEDPVEYSGPESLVGKKFGGVLGHYYVGIDDYVERGLIQREDANSFSKNLQKLIMRRVNTEVIIIPDAQLKQLMKERAVASQIYISKTPHQQFTRQLLVTPGLADVRDYIDAQLPILKPEWIERVNSYALKRVE